MIGVGATCGVVIEEEVKEDCGFGFGWLGEQQFKQRKSRKLVLQIKGGYNFRYITFKMTIRLPSKGIQWTVTYVTLSKGYDQKFLEEMRFPKDEI